MENQNLYYVQHYSPDDCEGDHWSGYDDFPTLEEARAFAQKHFKSYRIEHCVRTAEVIEEHLAE